MTYDPEYYQKNKKQIKEQQKKYYLKNREKILKYKNQQHKKNKDKEKEYQKQYYLKNRERNLLKGKKRYEENPNYWKQYYQNNLEKIKEYNKKHKKKSQETRKIRNNKNLKIWLQIIKEHYGEIKCQRCGYSKNFGAIDFHHKNPNEKDIQMGKIFSYKPTSERIESFKLEMEKCNLLCKICHSELHWPNLELSILA